MLDTVILCLVPSCGRQAAHHEITGLSKGQHMYVTLDLEPGTFALYCFAPDAKDGKERIAHGVVKEIQVEGAAAGASR